MNQELPALITEASAIAVDAERTFARLNRDQLNWKRAVGSRLVGLFRVKSPR